MTTPRLFELVQGLPKRRLGDAGVLQDAGNRLGIDWPADYVAVMSEHDGAEGDVGAFNLVLQPAAELLDVNTDPVMEFFPGLVIVGGDGGGEALAIHRDTHEVLLVPWIGDQDDWLLLGRSFTEALERLATGDAFKSPHWVPPSSDTLLR